jgi:hypothetical protein
MITFRISVFHAPAVKQIPAGEQLATDGTTAVVRAPRAERAPSPYELKIQISPSIRNISPSTHTCVVHRGGGISLTSRHEVDVHHGFALFMPHASRMQYIFVNSDILKFSVLLFKVFRMQFPLVVATFSSS